jgi:tripartite-type tricarboxylate transporter receptor subunit TctC
MIEMAKSKPGALSYATTGRGRLTHLAMELLQSSTNTKLQMVSYNGGAAQAMSDLTNGRVDFVLEAYAGLAPMFNGNLLKGFATTNPTRAAAFPDIPAIAETVPGFSVIAWGVFVAPLGTPDAIIAKANADIRKAQEDPDLIAKLAMNGGETRFMTPAEVTAFVNAEQAKWLPVLERAMKDTP